MQQVFDPKKLAVLTFDWTDLLSGSVIGGILLEIARIWRRYMDKRNLPSETMQKFNEMYSKGLKPILDQTAAERVLIWKAENGGGALYPGSEIYASVMYEDYRRPLSSIIDDIQRWKVDKTTLEILQKLCSEGMIKIVVGDLPQSKIKTIFQGYNIHYTEFHFLSQTKTKLFYATISTTSKVSQYELPAERAAIDLSINHLRNIFKKTAKHIK